MPEATYVDLMEIIKKDIVIKFEGKQPVFWGTDSIASFLTEMVDAQMENYLAGTIVIYPIKNKCIGISSGKKRLTTIVLVLCAIRGLSTTKKKGLIGDLIHEDSIRFFRKASDNNGCDEQVRFPFFEKIVEGLGSHSNFSTLFKESVDIREAYEKIEDFVRAYVDHYVRSSSGLHSPENAKVLALETLTKMVISIKFLQIIFDRESQADDFCNFAGL